MCDTAEETLAWIMDREPDDDTSSEDQTSTCYISKEQLRQKLTEQLSTGLVLGRQTAWRREADKYFAPATNQALKREDVTDH